MTSEITIHTGYDRHEIIHLAWGDENCQRHDTTIEVVCIGDKGRYLSVMVNGVEVAKVKK